MVEEENKEIAAAPLTPRQEMLLGLIVRENVRVATPIASRALVEQYHLSISSATVRNEMARLEELGYLSQPHTSAGRVPTEDGFRYFVERLMEEQTLPPAEQRTIAHQFYQARNHIEEWMPLAASVLASRTQGAALVTAPIAISAIYRHLELLSTYGQTVLLVLVLEGGTVRQQMLVASELINQGILSEIADRFNQLCNGLTADEIKRSVPLLTPLEADFMQVILSLMAENRDITGDTLYQHGISQLLMQPEFADAEDRSTRLVRVLEEQSLLQAVIADALSPSVGIGAVRILIGGEGRWNALSACSVILTRYGIANYVTGALGVVGPIRMAYGRTVSVLRFVSGILSDLAYETYRPALQEIPPDED
ncbi:MAG: heat-inducible transcription repressor HrcA [Anaerolineae bacterium]|nr:heat-inducible transcription repressor HrcA [Anaerolineae bacterium]